MRSVILRIFAVFAYSAMAVIGGSAIVGGIPVWKAAVLAGISATAHVVEKLARAYADDGHSCFRHHISSDFKERWTKTND